MHPCTFIRYSPGILETSVDPGVLEINVLEVANSFADDDFTHNFSIALSAQPLDHPVILGIPGSEGTDHDCLDFSFTTI